ncbi:MAG: 4a-hydroxytetrahydrobiopterin dehydratase [Candidatus Paceibacterota bacterium]|jgi:4a-hydroxytetrahydrobiopterin dehydratase
MNNNLTQKKCLPCEGGVPPLDKTQMEELIKETPGWEITEEGKKIKREFKFKDFKETIVFVNKVAELAESEGHHPDIHIFYSRLELELWTHMIGGLSENDFILAAKINALL